MTPDEEKLEKLIRPNDGDEQKSYNRPPQQVTPPKTPPPPPPAPPKPPEPKKSGDK